MLTEKQRAQTAARQRRFRERLQERRRGEQAAKGLPALPSIPNMPGRDRWNATFQAAYELIAGAVGEMQAYYDDRSESWQESERGEEHQERISSVEAVLDGLAELIS